ncbi:DUF883 family protein [Duganella aceris]|jgi:ElaB/YqjD/DUF883 family membrane-anchored ribosome-binding protein|uniref:DUF883 family protein n=1 Tax=Duganella aceris TaxID=2703883 RepID=A0ABX0FF59_9BURK|nr:DUF883 family protein [Duganella aceris]NGZ83171.1 DUF883 family protein [Duganella aceris]
MSNKKSTAATDVANLITEARSHFDAAAATPIADKAKELREQGSAALTKVGTAYDELQTSVVDGAEEAAGSVDAFVRANPWRSAVLAATVGILGGVLIARS